MGGCVEQYLPHRVAMQFGMDQDIPGIVASCNKDPWMSYSQSVMDVNLRIALFSCQPSVTSRYYDWWEQSKSGKEGDAIEVEGYDHCMISISSSENLSPASSRQVEDEGDTVGVLRKIQGCLVTEKVYAGLKVKGIVVHLKWKQWNLNRELADLRQ
ncbi:Aminotransferase-like, plant mobile domain [Sesbania bispinosa]|nr:Aminotransferase-like, plant mobile domain [Sesbania bispinosa]